jgi:uncharacterized membrane protein
MPAEEEKHHKESSLKESESSEPSPVVVKQEPEKELVTWKAASRPFKRRDRRFYITVFAMAGITALVLFAIEGVMPVVLIVALVFLFYVLSTVEPEEIEYTITNKGIKVADKKTGWAYLGRFWFRHQFDSELLVIEAANLVGRMELVIDKGKRDDIKKALSSHLTEEEIPPAYLDKAANWFAQKLPGNR